MISWQLVPALRIGLALAAGIACTRLPIQAHLFTTLIWIAMAIAITLLVWPLPVQTRAKYRGWGILIATISVGLLLGILSSPQPPNQQGAGAKAFVFRLDASPTKATNWYRVDGEVTSFRADSGWTISSSRVRLLLPPARVTPEMRTGATYLVNARISLASSASNPHSFNYADYLARQGITLQAFAPPVQLGRQNKDASIVLGLLGLISWRKELAWLKLLVFWAALFAYAALTGFSPSVQRSAVMFGILFAGKILRKDANAFNSLGLSAIILLAFDPQLLFELGFQLSYCAVAGILAFYPSLRKRFASNNYWFNAIGELNAVSIAATIGTLPLTTFYFHQFPVYFLLSGIFAVPLVGFALPALLGGIGIDTIFHLFGSSAYWAYIPAYMLIWLCNACLEAIASLPKALVSGLWPSTMTTALAIGSVILLGAAFLRKRKRLYWTALSCGLICAGSITSSTISKLRVEQVLVYNLQDDLVVDAFSAGLVQSTVGRELQAFTKRSKEAVSTHRNAMNARLDTSESLFISSQLSPKPAISFGFANDYRFAVLPSEFTSLTNDGPSVDFVFIPEPKVVVPAQLITAFPTATYVLGGNIPPWKSSDWGPLASSIYKLKEQGAFILD